MATGYRHNLRAWLTLSDERLADLETADSKATFSGKMVCICAAFICHERDALHEIARLVRSSMIRQNA